MKTVMVLTSRDQLGNTARTGRKTGLCDWTTYYKALARDAAAAPSSASQRFRIVTDLKDPSRVALRQTTAASGR